MYRPGMRQPGGHLPLFGGTPKSVFFPRHRGHKKPSRCRQRRRAGGEQVNMGAALINHLRGYPIDSSGSGLSSRGQVEGTAVKGLSGPGPVC